jgi:Holliday junction resolvasome RuvABC ATP-dependent DNA helicase subunit
MNFHGQIRIFSELEYLIPAMREGQNLNILIRAPSGYGKTKLAVHIALSVDENNCELFLANERFEEFSSEKRIIIIDEVHLITNPEFLYPHMDSGKHIFILCSNEFGQLKEPLSNRCIDLTFDLYSDQEIGEIIFEDFQRNSFTLSDPFVIEVVRNSNGIPRTARNLVKTLSMIFKIKGVPDSIESLQDILRNTLQLEDGLNPLHRRYLDYIQKVERASLDTLIFATRLDKSTILREIEPVLINKNLIRITSRGRVCNK